MYTGAGARLTVPNDQYDTGMPVPAKPLPRAIRQFIAASALLSRLSLSVIWLVSSALTVTLGITASAGRIATLEPGSSLTSGSRRQAAPVAAPNAAAVATRAARARCMIGSFTGFL